MRSKCDQKKVRSPQNEKTTSLLQTTVMWNNNRWMIWFQKPCKKDLESWNWAECKRFWLTKPSTWLSETAGSPFLLPDWITRLAAWYDIEYPQSNYDSKLHTKVSNQKAHLIALKVDKILETWIMSSLFYKHSTTSNRDLYSANALTRRLLPLWFKEIYHLKMHLKNNW